MLDFISTLAKFLQLQNHRTGRGLAKDPATDKLISRPDRLPDASKLKGAKDPEALIAQASEDLNLLKDGHAPKYAGNGFRVWDGGTTHFECEFYQISNVRSLINYVGVSGRWIGQSIIFKKSATGGENIIYSNTKFVPSWEEIGKSLIGSW